MDGEDRIPVYVYEITAGYLFDPISVALLDFHWYIPTDTPSPPMILSVLSC